MHTKKKNVYQNAFSKSDCIFFQNLYGVKLYLCKSHTNEVLFLASHNAPCLPGPKFWIIFNFSQDYCSTHEKKLRWNLSGNWVRSIFSGLKIKITQLPGGLRPKNKGYAKLWGQTRSIYYGRCANGKNSSFVHHRSQVLKTLKLRCKEKLGR